jgi:flagellar motility protein MotE (MotC chaperone)
LEEEKKKLKQDRQNAKKRAKEISKQESALNEEENKGNGLMTFFATVFIIVVWLAIMVLVVKTDVGGFGSGVLAPLIEDIPILNRILPKSSVDNGATSSSDIAGMRQEIETLRLQLEAAQASSSSSTLQIEQLLAEIERLKKFEDKQVEFERIQKEFYEEVIYSANGPGAEAFREYYEEMDKTTADYLYKQVVAQQLVDDTIQDYVDTYAQMDPSQAAAIFEEMTDSMALVAQILNAMTPEERGEILGEMSTQTAAKLTKLLDPSASK